MGRFEGECSGKTLASVILLSIGSTLELLDENEGTLHVTGVYMYMTVTCHTWQPLPASVKRQCLYM